MVVIVIMLMINYVNNNNNLRHDKVVGYNHWELCGKCGLARASNWYEQKP